MPELHLKKPLKILMTDRQSFVIKAGKYQAVLVINFPHPESIFSDLYGEIFQVSRRSAEVDIKLHLKKSDIRTITKPKRKKHHGVQVKKH